MRVVFISHSSDTYGAERSLYELVQGITAFEAAEPSVVLPGKGPLMQRFRALKVPVHLMPYSRWASGRTSLPKRLRSLARNGLAVRDFRRLFDRTEPDLVVTNTATVPSAAIAAHSEGLPHLWCVHEHADPAVNVGFHWGEARTFRLVGRLSSRVIACSYELKRYLSQWIAPDHIRILYPSVDVPSVPVQSSPRSAPSIRRIVVVAHKVEGKGQEDAIRALGELQRWRVPAHLTLVGPEEAGYGAYLRKLKTMLGLDELVEFVGSVEDPYAFMIQSAIVLVCSRRESLGRVAIEAMKLGRPVVVANNGGSAELVRDGWNGLMYRAGDPLDLASKIRLLLDDEALMARLIDAGRSYALGTFSSERYVRGFMATAQEVVVAAAPDRDIGGHAVTRQERGNPL